MRAPPPSGRRSVLADDLPGRCGPWKLSCARNSACRAGRILLRQAALLLGRRAALQARARPDQRTGGRSTAPRLSARGGTGPRTRPGAEPAATEYRAGQPSASIIAREGRLGDGDFHYFSTGMGTAVECNDYPVAGTARPTSPSAGPARSGDRRLPRRRRRYGEPADDLAIDGFDRMPSGRRHRWDGAAAAGSSAAASLCVLVLWASSTTSPPSARPARSRASTRRAGSASSQPGHASDLYYPYRSPAVRWIRRFVGSH